jgi:antitoxin (DNA-binding transcriptional repressor) of toxin-antitoxin stability system
MLRYRLFPLALLLVLFVPRLSWGSSLLLCGGAQVTENEVALVEGKPTLKEIWHWRPEESEGLPMPLMRKFITTDDCKAVSQGNEILITSSGDAVALISHATGKTLFYATVKNAHSAELLPGGFIAVASSSDSDGGGDRIVLFDRHEPDKALMALPLTAAHGVVWDSKREVLWALGGRELVRLRLDSATSSPRLITEKSVPLPAREGHDLQITSDCSSLYVTNTKSVFRVDPDRMSFEPYEPFRGLGEIKSLSINPTTRQIAFTRADPGVWWTYTLRFLNPGQQIILPMMIYKARWF